MRPRKENKMESDVEKISINGVSYVPEGSVIKEDINSDIKIVVLQRF